MMAFSPSSIAACFPPNKTKCLFSCAALHYRPEAAPDLQNRRFVRFQASRESMNPSLIFWGDFWFAKSFVWINWIKIFFKRLSALKISQEKTKLEVAKERVIILEVAPAVLLLLLLFALYYYYQYQRNSSSSDNNTIARIIHQYVLVPLGSSYLRVGKS